MAKEGKNFFVTGKAGTGKTTCLKDVVSLLKEAGKHVAVLAPIGIAAKNAEGVTIHSFLKLPLGLYIPGIKKRGLYRQSSAHIEVVKKLDAIIIDEVSMVRCDLMDEIDDVLRYIRRKPRTPFGGIQLILFGDMHQLMPIAKDDEEREILKYYNSMYFFDSKVIRKMEMPIVELKKVYRQDDRDFVKILNEIRKGKYSASTKALLNTRIKYGFMPDDKECYIKLTTHNRRARRYNHRKMGELRGNKWTYTAYQDGYYPVADYPTDVKLELMIGARVMFVKNDTEGRFVNGTLGTVKKLSKEVVSVKTDEGDIIDVEETTWHSYKYILNKSTNEIETICSGSFTQFPLKLAWAITIHKSQGLTFDKVIIDAGKAFTYGQVYVALSRCRSLEGIVLASTIKDKGVQADPMVKSFLRKATKIDCNNRHATYKLNPSVEETLKMVEKHCRISTIASRRKLTEATIYNHVCTIVQAGLASPLIYISKRKYNHIVKIIDSLGDEVTRNKIMKNCTIKDVSYNDIDIVLAEKSRKA